MNTFLVLLAAALMVLITGLCIFLPDMLKERLKSRKALQVVVYLSLILVSIVMAAVFGFGAYSGFNVPIPEKVSDKLSYAGNMAFICAIFGLNLYAVGLNIKRWWQSWPKKTVHELAQKAIARVAAFKR